MTRPTDPTPDSTQPPQPAAQGEASTAAGDVSEALQRADEHAEALADAGLASGGGGLNAGQAPRVDADAAEGPGAAPRTAGDDAAS